MADKNLNLNTKINDAQAKAALNGLIQGFKNADAAHKQYLRSLGGVDDMLKKVPSHAMQARDAMGRFTTDSSANFTNFLNKAVKPVNGALADMGNQFKSLLKWGSAFAMITGTLYLRKAGQDLISYTESFSMMNATLRAKLPETQKLINDTLLAMSSKYGVRAEDVTNSFNQLLSSGFLPQGKEGSKEYNDSLMQTIMIQDELAQAAVATGVSFEEMQKAVIFTSNAFGVNIREAGNMKIVTNALAGTLDQGIGWMSEYSQQFVKFAADAKQAGASMNDALGVFALMTRTQSVNKAGFTTDALFRTLGSSAEWATYAQQSMKHQMSKLDLNPAEMKAVGGLTTAQGWLNMQLTGSVDGKGQRVKNDFITLLGNVQKTLKGVSSDKATLISDIFLSAVARNVNAKRAINLLTNGDTSELTDIIKYIGEANQDNLIKQKFDIMMGSYSKRWEIFTQSMRNAQLEVSLALAPGMQLILDTLSGQLNGKPLSKDTLSEGFAKLRSEMEKSHPALMPVVNMMEKFAGYVNDGKLVDNLKTIAGGLASMASAAGKTMSFIDKLTSGNILMDIGIAWFGTNLVMNLLKGAGFALGTSMVSALTGSAAAAGAVSLGTLMAGGFIVAALAAAALIGYKIWQAENRKNEEANLKESDLNTNRLDSVKASKARLLAGEGTDQDLANVQGAQQETFQLDLGPPVSAIDMVKRYGTGALGRLSETKADLLKNASSPAGADAINSQVALLEEGIQSIIDFTKAYTQTTNVYVQMPDGGYVKAGSGTVTNPRSSTGSGKPVIGTSN